MNKKAFTLVELIVVITILAVLATVAFISFQGYAANSRDSVRLADMKSIQKVISIFKETKGKYPLPNDNTNITYSGTTAWTQGIFGTNAYSDTISMGNVPTDPLTLLPYSYSVTNTRQEHQLAVVLEGNVTDIHTQTYAGDQIANVFVKGDYNGTFLKIQIGTLNYLLGVPSILASDITSVDMMDVVNNQRLVYKGYNNLPASFSGSIYNNNGGFAFIPNKVVLFEGNIDDLVKKSNDRINFLNNLQTNYTGSTIADESGIAELLGVDTGSPSTADTYIANAINNSLKTNINITDINTNILGQCVILSQPAIKTCNQNTWILNTNTNTCTNDLTVTLGDSCPDGYTNNGDGSCSQINSYSATASCPSNYSNYNSSTCRRIQTKSANIVCTGGYYGGGNGLCYKKYSATICPTGYSFDDTGCRNKSITLDGAGNCSNGSYPHRKPVHASPDRCYQSSGDYYLEPTCASQYIHIGGELCYNPNQSIPESYSCDSGYSYNGSICQKTSYTGKIYSCNSGGILSGNNCEITDTISSTSGSCPNDYNIQGDGITCLQIQTEAAIVTCDGGFDYNSNSDQCEKCN